MSISVSSAISGLAFQAPTSFYLADIAPDTETQIVASATNVRGIFVSTMAFAAVYNATGLSSGAVIPSFLIPAGSKFSWGWSATYALTGATLRDVGFVYLASTIRLVVPFPAFLTAAPADRCNLSAMYTIL